MTSATAEASTEPLPVLNQVVQGREAHGQGEDVGQGTAEVERRWNCDADMRTKKLAMVKRRIMRARLNDQPCNFTLSYTNPFRAN